MMMFVTSRFRCLLITLAVALLMSSFAFATKKFEPQFYPRLEVQKAHDAISVDGDLNDPGWQRASKVESFVERYPGDNTEPEVETRAFLTYDENNLYVAFLCQDDPATIRATMCQRDRFGGDDVVRVLIDTYGDATRAYELFVNPYGVQKDILWSSVGGEDIGYDLIWTSAAEITDSGYQVEIAVPFSSMRFPNKDVQAWKVDFQRDRPREVYRQYSWAAYDRNEQCWACQWGTVEGISNVRPGQGLEILPTVVSYQSGRLMSDGQGDANFESSDPRGEFSLGGKYSVNSDVTVEATYNPDFSQIEADAAQIDVNTTIALYYPERRPFFQEGSDIFRTLFNSFYTRTVNDPQFAGKLTARTGGTSIGFLSAYDENSPYIIPLGESSLPVNTGQSTVNVLRGLQSIGDDNTLGFMVGDRRFDGGGSGTVLALDGDIRISKNYSIDGQYIYTHTTEPNNDTWKPELGDATFADGKHTIVLDGESFSGFAFITRFLRNSRHWDFNIDYNQVDPTYRTQVGYDPLNDYRNFSVYTNYTIYPKNSVLQRLTPGFYTAARWALDGTNRWQQVNLGLDGQLSLAQTYFSLGYEQREERYLDRRYENLWTANFGFGSQLFKQLGYDISILRSHNIARFAQTTGNETSVAAYLTIKPADRIVIEPNLRYAKSTDAATGDELYSGYIARTRVRYQFNRELSLRLVVQYNDFGETWDVDPLIAYQISPFSVLYLGSTYDYANVQLAENAPYQWKMTSRQFFIKLQYLFQT